MKLGSAVQHTEVFANGSVHVGLGIKMYSGKPFLRPNQRHACIAESNVLSFENPRDGISLRERFLLATVNQRHHDQETMSSVPVGSKLSKHTPANNAPCCLPTAVATAATTEPLSFSKGPSLN